MFHGSRRADDATEEEISTVSVRKIRFEMMLQRDQNQIDVPLIFKHVIHRIFKADKSSVLLPVSAKDEVTALVTKSIHVPPNKKDLQHLFQYNINPRKVEGLFRIRTNLSIQEIKTNPEVMEFLSNNKIWIKETQFNSSRCTLIGWLYGSHSYYTRRDDATQELRRRMRLTEDQHFCLVPGRVQEVEHDKTTGKDRVIVLESLKVEVPVEDADEIKRQFFSAFEEEESIEFPITRNMQFIPKQPTESITRETLCNWAIKQNLWCDSLAHTFVRGVHNIDETLDCLDGSKITLRQALLQTTISEGVIPFRLVERANYDRIILVHEKRFRYIAKTFQDTLQNIMTGKFVKESIDKVICTEPSFFTGATGKPGQSTPSPAFQRKLLSQTSSEQRDNVLLNPPKRPQRRPISVEGTPFEPSQHPSGAPRVTANRSYAKAVNPQESPADANPPDLSQMTTSMVEMATNKVQKLQTESEEVVFLKVEKATQEVHSKVDAQLAAAAAKLSAFKQANDKSEDNFKRQEKNISNLSDTITSVTEALSGMQNRVVGIEKNVGHMTAAVNNLTQNVMAMKTQLSNFMPQAFPQQQHPTYIPMPPRPLTRQEIPAPVMVPLVFRYEDREDDMEVDAEDLTENGIAPDASGGDEDL